MPHRSPWPRRLISAALILAAAGAITLWSGRQRQRELEQITAFVTNLCEDLRRGRDAGRRFAATEAALAQRVTARLREAVASAGPQDLRIVVTEGDTEARGSAPALATHTAVVRRDGAEVLGLRLVHRDGGGPPAIIGFWSP